MPIISYNSMVANTLSPGYLYFDGFKYITDPTLQGPPGPIGPTGATGPAGTITAGNYVLSAPLSLDGYVTIKYLHTSSGLLSDGYLTINGLTEINNDVTMAAGTMVITGNAALAIGTDNAGSFIINAGVVSSIEADISFSGESTFNGNIITNDVITINDELNVTSSGSATFDCNVTIDAGNTLYLDGFTVATSNIDLNSGSLLKINTGGTISIDGNVFVNSAANFQVDCTPVFSENLNVGGNIFGRPAYNTNTLSNTDGYMSTNSDGNILTCNASGGTKTKTIDDDGSVAQGSWMLLRNIGVSDIQVNSPLGGGMSTLSSGNCVFLVKMGPANSTWIALFKTSA